jgi:hypothetical protein
MTRTKRFALVGIALGIVLLLSSRRTGADAASDAEDGG